MQGLHVPDLGEGGLQGSGGGQRDMDGNTGQIEIYFGWTNPDPYVLTPTE